jgi:hypothetical protein
MAVLLHTWVAAETLTPVRRMDGSGTAYGDYPDPEEKFILWHASSILR